MVSIVSRHPFPPGSPAGIAILQEDSSEQIEGLEADSSDLGEALRTALVLAKSHCLLDTTGQKLPSWESWVSAMQLGSAVFAAATTTEPTVTCRIADKDRTLQATGVQPYTNAGTWLTAFYLAVVCRERDRITALCRVPISLLRESGAQFDEFQYQWIETLQEYWVGTGDIVPTLTAAVHGTDPEASTLADSETVAKLLYPPMELFHRFITRNNEEFNRSLDYALQWHKDYWSEESRAIQSSGLVALAPLAMVCFARDAGMPIEVESEYLPSALLDRSWIGEFPT